MVALWNRELLFPECCIYTLRSTANRRRLLDPRFLSKSDIFTLKHADDKGSIDSSAFPVSPYDLSSLRPCPPDYLVCPSCRAYCVGIHYPDLFFLNVMWLLSPYAKGWLFYRATGPISRTRYLELMVRARTAYMRN